MSEAESEGPLSRWSRRKLEAREQLRTDNNLQPDKQPVGLSDAAAEGKIVEPDAIEEPVLTDEDMPPVESLTEDSDFSQFMSPGVSDKLRNLALRKMFHAPSFNIRDGLDEYDEDYTFFEPLGDIVTCDMKHQMEMLEKKKQEEAEALVDEDIDEVEGDIEDEVEDDKTDTVEALSRETDTEGDQQDEPAGFSENTGNSEMNEVKNNE